MPNRKVHVATSTFAGAFFASNQAAQQPAVHQLIESIGGIIGGWVGGRLPDLIEPPTSPNHRGSAHSFAVVGGLIKVGNDSLGTWQERLREKADELAVQRAGLPADSLSRPLYALAEVLCRLLAGLLAGLTAGYVTHLMLDAGTPRSLRIV